MSANTEFISQYFFTEDRTKPGRILEQVKVGEVYISRLLIEPNVVTGNFYHKKTNTILFVEKGEILAKFFQINSKEEKQVKMFPGDGIVHVPTFVAMATKNVGKEQAVIIMFGDKPFRAGDDYGCEILD